LVIGVRESSILNAILTVINLLVTLLVIVVGLTKVDIHNWNIKPNEIHPINNGTIISVNVGKGGFFPYGISGMLSGAATCFYAFIGFDILATTGYFSLLLSNRVCYYHLFVYCTTSIVITLMVPYFLLDKNTALTQAFLYAGYPAFSKVISVGALVSLFGNLLVGMIALPRLIYSIACDGLIFRSISYIQPKLQTPIVATIIGGLLTGLVASIFDLSTLIEMTTIGTLMAYTLVSITVLFLRYKSSHTIDELTIRMNIVRELFLPLQSYPTVRSQRIMQYSLVVFGIIQAFV
ncbi:unnamed protein product, partial [Didymodactylos carnosus]